MAIFHCTVKTVSRGKNQSAIAKAAYNARDDLREHATGELKSFSHHSNEVLFSGIFAPENVPEWVKDREALWNAAEMAENRKDAQLAREVEIALPHELTDEQRIWLVKDYVREAFVRQGMVADVNIHAPDKEGDQRNHHAHILLTTREIGPDGFGLKERDWNSKATLEEWRERLENLTNRHLERHGHEERVDRRTLEAQGIDRDPTQHKGPQICEMEKRGMESEVEQRRAAEREATSRRQDGADSPEVQKLKESLRTVDTMLDSIESGRSGLHETSSEIRLAYALTDSGTAFAAALEDRGLALARVSAEEARASERASAFAKEAGGYVTHYTEDELVVVNGFGGVYRLDQKSLDIPAAEIEKYLASINRSELLTLGDARDVMRTAAIVDFRNERQAEREAGRDVTAMEQMIARHYELAPSGGAFAANLYQEGIVIAHADRNGIEDLHRDQQSSFNRGELSFEPFGLGDGNLVAIDKFGGVHALNYQKLDIAGIETALTEGTRTIPSLGNARNFVLSELAADQAGYEQRNQEFWSGVAERQQSYFDAAHLGWLLNAKDERDRADRGREDIGDQICNVINVIDKSTGALVRLADYACDLVCGAPKSLGKMRPSEQIIARRQASAALRRIRDDVVAERNLRSEDLQALTPEHLQNISARGDAYIHEIVMRMNEDRVRQQEYGRGRER